MAGALIKIPNHVDQAKARLATEFRQTLIEAMLESFVLQIQDLETVNCELIEERDCQTAVGVQLDKVGDIVGELRNGRDDDDYRQGIKAQICINNSKGTHNDILVCFQLLTQCDEIQLTPYFPAVLCLFADCDLSGLNVAQLYDDMQQVVAAGVRLDCIGWYNGECPFVFFESTDPEGLGFGDTLDVDVGGKLAEILVP